MKKRTIYFSLLVLLIAGNACEKIIDLDINESNPQLVVEANIESGKVCRVKLSKTKSLFEEEATTYINNAVVRLKSSAGEEETLSLEENGLYTSSAITGTETLSYNLSIESEGEIYEATTTIPAKVALDTIEFQKVVTPMRTMFMTVAKFTDPAEFNNYYKVNFYIKDTTWKKVPSINVENDQLSNGAEIGAMGTGMDIETGDSVLVELLSIDQQIYDYFYTLDDVIGSGMMGSSAPYNPTSNISNGALGYFGGWSVDKRKGLVNE